MVQELKERTKPKKVMPKPANEKIELTKRRTRFSKEYLNPDGTFTVELFDKPIHFKNKKGYWKKIDNDIEKLPKGGYEYANKDNVFTVRFSQNNLNDKLVLISYDEERWISFSPVDKFTTTGSINKSIIEYKGIREDIDLKYTVDNARVKEEIIVRKYPNANSFIFNLDSQGVIFTRMEDGLIWVINEETQEKLFYLQKSYAEDQKGNITYDIDIDITQDEEGRKLIINIDDQWLQNAAYPVIIDPTIGVNVESDTVDTYVSSTNATTSYYLNNYLHTGYLSGYGTLRSYVRFKYLPTLPSGAKIIDAHLNMFMYLASTGGTTVNVHKVNQLWQSSEVTWNNQPTYDTTPIVSNFSYTPNSEWLINITTLVRDWYEGKSSNYGVMLRASNESSSKISFYSSNASANPTPKMTINYTIDGLGTEAFWSLDGNVNVYNGNMVLQTTDVVLPGRGIPIVVSRTYNLRSEETTVLGYRWRLNVGMRINFAADEKTVLYIDGDGTKKYFSQQLDGSYKSPVGIYSTLKKEGGVFVIEERSGVKYYFTADGRLDKIVDTDNNITNIFYQADGNIARIEDPSLRKVYFNYTNGKLTSITGSEIPTVEYEYSGIHLTRVSKKNDAGTVLDETTFGYDTWNNLVSVTDDLNQTTTIAYSYTEDLGRRVEKIQKQVTLDGILQTITTNYNYVKTISGVVTTVTDPMGNITEYTTNNMGNITKVIEDKGGLNLTTQMSWDEDQNLVEGIPPKGLSQPDSYKTVLLYDEDGDVNKIENAKGDSAIYKYNDKHDMTQAIDFAGRPSIYQYDTNTRNMTASADPLFSTSVMNYDSYGNIISQTNPIALGGNMLANTTFQDWSGNLPVHWEQLSSGGTVAQDSTYKVNGYYSAKLTSWGSAENQRMILINDYIPINESSKYTVSWYVKTENVLQTNGGATVTVHWYNDNQGWMGAAVNLAPTTGTTGDFVRKGARINAPIGAHYARVALEVNDSGTAWYDDVQFELGSVINQYNLVYNEGFEVDMDQDTIPDGWTKGVNSTVDDGINTTYAHTGTRSIVLNGNTTNKLIYQRIDLPGEAGTPIYFSGWSKAEGISSTGGYYQVLITVFDEGVPVGYYGVDFTKSTHDWEFKERVFVTETKFTYIQVYAKLENQTGKAWFDDFTVRLAGAPNALMSRYNIAQNGSFEDNKETPLDWPDQWRIYHSTVSGTYNIEWIQSTGEQKAFTGDRMLKISNVPDWAVVSNDIYEPLKAGTTYTATAVIKTENVSGGGAIVKFDILDAYNAFLGTKLSKVIKGTNDWERVVVSISTEEAKALYPTAAQLKIAVGASGQITGTMYIDAVRMFQESIETKYSYDANKNYVTGITNPLGDSINLTRDNRGNVTQVTDPKNNVFTFAYDELDRIKQSKNPQGLTSLYYYDKNSNLTQIDNHSTVSGYLNTVIRYEYNEMGLPKKATDSNWRDTLLEYNANGNLTTAIYPNGKEIHHQYDGADRIIQTTYVGDTTKWNYGYDANSNLTSVIKNDSETTNLAYDNLDQLIKITYPTVNSQRNTTQYSYTPMGDILNITDTIGATSILTRYDYDYAGNNVDIFGPEDTLASYLYDEERKVKKSFVQGKGKYYITYRNYNSLGRTTRIFTLDNLGNIVLDYLYEYDKNQNRTKEINNIAKNRKEYNYDSINQLIEERSYSDLLTSSPSKTITYQYDILGNMTQKNENGIVTTYGYNIANEITTKNNNLIYVHDTNGNLTDITDTGWKYVYNARNQLIRVEKSGIVVGVYEYDSEGLRTKKIANGITERYYYNGGKLTYITNVENKLRYYFTRDKQGRPLQMFDYSGAPTETVEVYWYHYDAHGNVVGLWDKEGNKVVSYTYDSWGKVTETGLTYTKDGILLREANPFKYCAYQYDKETGFYYLKNRYYMPSLGRFTTRDMVLYRNRYAYATNNPVNYIDPSGYLVTLDAEGYVVQLPSGEIEDLRGNRSPVGWLDSTEPLIPYKIPSSNEVISNLSNTALGTTIGTVSSMEKRSGGYIDDIMVRHYPSSSNIYVKPYKKIGKVSTAMTYGSAVLDVGNTWTADTGNTNRKRILKTVIQGVGIAALIGVGVITGKMIALVVAGVGVGFFAGVALIAGAFAMGFFAGELVSKAQNRLYRSLGIN